VGLAEALKIRVISKGPPLLYTVLKPLQKFMWETLKENKVFELIGKPVSESTMEELFGTTLDPSKIIISGDYKSSTDNLRRWVSECIARAIANRLRENKYFSPTLEELLIRSLTGHIFVDENGIKMPQQEGQLMGSVTSFPILCIANAAMCRWAIEQSDGARYRVTDRPSTISRGRLCPLRVNGDDCVFWGDKARVINIWEQITAFGGLETSVGKTYYSSKFAVINSVLYDYIPGTIPVIDPTCKYLFTYQLGRWRERRYVNLGLVFGMKRSEGKENKSNNVVKQKF